MVGGEPNAHAPASHLAAAVLRLTDIRAPLGHPGSVTRSIPLPVHAALELALGLALLVGPFALGLEPAGLVAAFSLGVLLVGLALAGPDSLPISTHQAFDLAVVAALGGGGVGLGLAGDPAAGLLLATIGALQLALLTLTRWARA
jgi:hypothetical protein